MNNLAIKTIVLFGLALVTLSACTTSSSVIRTDRYHESEKSDEYAKTLNGLQSKALQLMEQQDYENSILYFQRAIKVEPRNPLNWHYLAQNYLFLQNFEYCRSMAQRAISYSQFDSQLSKANEVLLQQCAP